MYEEFYGLTNKPFQLNPDPSFYFGSRQHQQAMAYLEYGLHRNEGFIVVTGEVGAGKTTLVRNLFNKLDSTQVIAANLVSTQLDADDILRMVASAFGIPSSNADKSNLLLSIEAYLLSVASTGKRCLLVVDEAQNLTPRAIEELRMLSNFQIEQRALLQSFLIGQPEFRLILQSPQMTQLRQRVIAACHVGPMDNEETEGYIKHRLTHVGWKKNSPQFFADAYQKIFQASGGIPRRINSICDRLLLHGFLNNNRVFTDRDVMKVVTEMDDETISPGTKKWHTTTSNATKMLDDLATEDIDLSQFLVEGETVQEAIGILGQLSQNDMAERIKTLENSLARIERRTNRLRRDHSHALALIERLLAHLKSDAPKG